MNGQQTIITNPESGESRKFAFDYSYWSFDGFKEEPDGYCSPDQKHKNGRKFCDQVMQGHHQKFPESSHILRNPTEPSGFTIHRVGGG